MIYNTAYLPKRHRSAPVIATATFPSKNYPQSYITLPVFHKRLRSAFVIATNKFLSKNHP
jgi:hypothetical protein